MPRASESVAQVIGRLFSVVITPGPNVDTSASLMCILDGEFKRVKQGRVRSIQVSVNGTRRNR